jgi:hypothetical protein
MYYISELSNIDPPRKTNEYDRYLAIENILPHQNTLARGYQSGHYEYLSTSQMGIDKDSSATNFHTRRLSESKVANIMQDTFQRLNMDQYISGGPTKFESMKNRSSSLVSSRLLPNPESRNDVMPVPEFAQSSSKQLDYEESGYHMRRQSMPAEVDMTNNKYIKRISAINDQIKLAGKLDTIKTGVMT